MWNSGTDREKAMFGMSGAKDKSTAILVQWPLALPKGDKGSPVLIGPSHPSLVFCKHKSKIFNTKSSHCKYIATIKTKNNVFANGE